MDRGTEVPDEASIAESLPEQDILIQSVCETMVPKLVAEDIPLLFSLLNDVFPNVGYTRAEMTGECSSCGSPSRYLDAVFYIVIKNYAAQNMPISECLKLNKEMTAYRNGN